jgi:hypothetical protein
MLKTKTDGKFAIHELHVECDGSAPEYECVQYGEDGFALRRKTKSIIPEGKAL